MPLVRPLAEWPDLICGPILRRVTPRSVAVFAAFKSPGQVTLTIRPKGSSGAGPAKTIATIGLGANLHIAQVEVVLEAGAADFVAGRIYEYQVQFSPASNSRTVKTLKDLGVLGGATPLGYEPDALPTFCLPPGLKNLRVMYGSCRKPHAPGPDALAFLDGAIESARDKALERPHQLLLGGDQIYADDVTLPLLKTLTATAGLLLGGWSHLEKLPDSSTPAASTVDWTADSVAPGYRRANFLTAATTLSSGALQGHLMFLGEFYAMYLFAWSDVLWPRLTDGRLTLPTLTDFPEMATEPPLLGVDLVRNWKRWNKWLAAKNDFEETRRATLFYGRLLARVRRVLANVPTYMIFDDHEITDDWFLDGKWDAAARKNPTTQQILRNGLLAYALFQDWGNHPERYSTGPGRSLLEKVQYSAGHDPVILDTPRECDEVLDLGLPTARSQPQKRMQWDYHVEGPEHVVIALDTRTLRAYKGTRAGRAGLMSADAMSRQIDARRATTGTRLPIIVSAAPVLGHPQVEAVQDLFVEQEAISFSLHHGAPVPYADYESWVGHLPTFEDFLKRVAAFRRAIIVSGDVHYAFSNQLAFFPDGTPPPAPSRIVQLCSSALKNQDLKTLAVGGLSFLLPPKIGWIAFDGALAADKREALLDSLMSTEKSPVGDRLTRMYHALRSSQRFGTPTVLPSGPWSSTRAFEIVRDLADDVAAAKSRTNWRYTIEYLRDIRLVAQRESETPGLSAALPPSLGNHLTRTILLDHGRAIVGDNNLGSVQFEVDAAGAPTVVHRLYWQPRNLVGAAISGFVMFSEMKASLTTPAAADRPVVFK